MLLKGGIIIKFKQKCIPISSGNVIVSNKDGNNFNFIFSDLSVAKHIYISTFNYYMEKEYIDSILDRLEEIRDIRVVFNAYDTTTICKIVERSITLNPYVQLYYNGANHSKIISTGKQMYVGSANYTGYSKENFEVGVEIKDEESIRAIEEQVFYNIYDTRIVVSDPIQPIITYFTVIITEYLKVMEWIEWFFDEAQKHCNVTINDIADIGFEFTDKVINVFQSTLKKLREFINNNGEYFKEEGISVINYIDMIDDRIKEPNDINLGLFSKQRFVSFHEDYMNCMAQYKKEFWIENLIEMKPDCISHERRIVNNIFTVFDMLLYLKVKWINDFSGTYKKKYEICEDKCIKWLTFPQLVNRALESLI